MMTTRDARRALYFGAMEIYPETWPPRHYPCVCCLFRASPEVVAKKVALRSSFLALAVWDDSLSASTALGSDMVAVSCFL